MSNLAECQKVLQSDVLVQRFEAAPLSYDAEYSFAIQQLKANDYLQKVALSDKHSFLSAVSNVATIGLSLNPAAKEAYLVPRKGKICLDPSYGGLIKLATDSGSILWVQANVVYESDTYEDNGPGEKPIHKHDPFSKERGEFVGVYCVAKTKEGDYLTTPMSAEDIYKIRDGSESVKKFGLSDNRAGPWVTHFEEMAKKTVIRRAFKTWTRSNKVEAESRLAHAVELSNLNEGMELKVSNPDVGQYTDTQKDFYDKLIEESNALGMYVFQETIPQTTRNNLYHSFESVKRGDGGKGKYQRIVDSLYDEGRDLFQKYLESFSKANETGDTDHIQELEIELAPEELDLIKERL